MQRTNSRASGIALPAHPLERFCELYVALLDARPWWEGRTMLRYCALALTTLAGEPRELAAQLDTRCEELRKETPWHRRSSVETMLAALLLRHGEGVQDFVAEVERAGALFRRHWTFSGRVYEALAIQVLRHASNDRRVSAEQVTRLAAIFEEMKRAHPWLTQKSDWPACALLACTDATPQQISQRMEALYSGLSERSFTRGEELQAAAQVLFFHPDAPSEACTRFASLYEAFRSSGLWMGRLDYDELALLAFAPQPSAEVLGVVQRHRERIRTLRAAPDRQTSFTLACGTALLELARSQTAVLLSHAQLLLHIHTILSAQQAAAIAAR